jgi:hypothetical protein
MSDKTPAPRTRKITQTWMAVSGPCACACGHLHWGWTVDTNPRLAPQWGYCDRCSCEHLRRVAAAPLEPATDKEQTGFCVCDDYRPALDCGIPEHRVSARASRSASAGPGETP